MESSVKLLNISSTSSKNIVCSSNVPKRMWSCRKKLKCSAFEREHEQLNETNLDRSPPAECDGPRLILDVGATTVRDETRQLERFFAVIHVPDHFLRLRHWPRNGVDLPVVHPVKVHFGHGRFEYAPQIPREGYVDFVHGLGC